jgi:ATP-dependent DNA helicase RecG
MDRNQLENLIKQGESHTSEFKATASLFKPAFLTACGFLNGDGGVVLIGVKNNGEIHGQDVTDNTRQEIAREIKKIEPPAQGQIGIKFVPTQENKFVIALEVLKGGHAPYTYDGRPYERIQSTTARMPQQRYDQLVAIRFKANFTWESLIAEKHTIDSLDHNLIFGVVRKAVEVDRMPEEALRQDIPKLLNSLDLLVDGHLKNAAVVLFGKKFLSDYPQCQLKLARFKGLDKTEFLDSDIVYGNLFTLLDRAMLFIRRHLPLAARIEDGKLERVETPIIPFSAIREAIINSLCHRDYSSRSGSIALAIFDDRMFVSNDGGVVPGSSIEKIKTGFSKPINPLISDVLYRCNLIEKWGRGIPGIINTCIAADDPEPDFLWDSFEFKITFAFPTTIKPPIIFSDEMKSDLTKRQNEIINILSGVDELKLKDILDRLEEKAFERSLRRDLSQLKELNIIDMRGRGRAVVWYLVPEAD